MGRFEQARKTLLNVSVDDSLQTCSILRYNGLHKVDGWIEVMVPSLAAGVLPTPGLPCPIVLKLEKFNWKTLYIIYRQ